MFALGTVAGALHYRLVEKYSEQLNVGNGVVLRNVSVLTPKPHHHYLNIIQTNFAAVYSKSCEGSILVSKAVHCCIILIYIRVYGVFELG